MKLVSKLIPASMAASIALLAGCAHAQTSTPTKVSAEAIPQRVSVEDLRKRFGAADDRYVTIKGVELRYRDEGTGPVLLLLHGSRSTLNAWDGLATHLKDRYRIIRFDMPPTGLSSALSDQAMKDIGSPENLVAGFLDALNVDKVNVAGVSSGGTMGYYFAATYPDRVLNLVLTNTPSNPVPGLKLETPPDLQAALDRSKKTGIEGKDFWSAYMGSLWGKQERLKPGFVDYYYETNLRVLEKNPFGLHALTANYETTMARLKAVRAPVMIAWGMRDRVLRPEEGKALYNYLENAQSRSFIELESVGHYPPMESPEAIGDIIDTFINRNR